MGKFDIMAENTVSLLPDQYTEEGLLDTLRASKLAGATQEALNELVEELRRRGHLVEFDSRRSQA